ncbi:MAG: rod shape-determining protein [Candidatus Shapirobacteria bacterium]|nr:rod shape-determining protein [Candidatus Shapirobacteria bacterium]
MNKLQNFIANFSWDIGIDLGTNNTLIYLKGKGVVLNEPTMLARVKRRRFSGLSAPKVKKTLSVAFGAKAKEMWNREPQQLEVISPIKNGIVSDMEGLEMLLDYYLKLIYEIPSLYPKLFRPRVIVSVPGIITGVQKRAVKTVILSAGAREVVLVEGLILAALGVGLSTEKTDGVVVVDIGGGKTEVGVVSMGGLVIGRGMALAGDDLDRAIINYVRMKYNLMVGPNSAERVKIDIGNMDPEGESKRSALLRGRDIETGLPKGIKISEAEVREAMISEVQKIVKLVAGVLDETPPELMEDVLKRGVILTGGGAGLKGIDKLIERKTKIATRVVEEPDLSVIRGIGELVENTNRLNTVRLVGGI